MKQTGYKSSNEERNNKSGHLCLLTNGAIIDACKFNITLLLTCWRTWRTKYTKYFVYYLASFLTRNPSSFGRSPPTPFLLVSELQGVCRRWSLNRYHMQHTSKAPTPFSSYCLLLLSFCHQSHRAHFCYFMKSPKGQGSRIPHHRSSLSRGENPFTFKELWTRFVLVSYHIFHGACLMDFKTSTCHI